MEGVSDNDRNDPLVVASGVLLLIAIGPAFYGKATGNTALSFGSIAVCGVAALLLLIHRLTEERRRRRGDDPGA